MIDLTPLDVRNKRGDFKKIMRGYDPHEVDIFLEMAADRLEVLVRESLQLRERTQTLQDQVTAQAGREQAVQDALVTAQELRTDIRNQTQREADHVLKEAESESRRIIDEAETEARRVIAEAEAEVRSRLRGIERQLDHAHHTMEELERRRVRFIKEFRSLLERELDVVDVEENREPFEDRTVDLDLGSHRGADAGAMEAPVEAPVVEAPVEAVPETLGEALHEEPVLTEPTSQDAGYIEAEEPATPEHVGHDHTADVLAAGAVATAFVSEEEVLEEITPDLDAPVAQLAESVEVEEHVDVAALRPEEPHRAAPPPNVGDQPSSLELELMARTDRGGPRSSPDHFPDVPDLETVLAEAGVEDATPPMSEEISPPPVAPRGDEPVLLFDPDDNDRLR